MLLTRRQPALGLHAASARPAPARSAGTMRLPVSFAFRPLVVIHRAMAPNPPLTTAPAPRMPTRRETTAAGILLRLSQRGHNSRRMRFTCVKAARPRHACAERHKLIVPHGQLARATAEASGALQLCQRPPIRGIRLRIKRRASRQAAPMTPPLRRWRVERRADVGRREPVRRRPHAAPVGGRGAGRRRRRRRRRRLTGTDARAMIGVVSRARRRRGLRAADTISTPRLGPAAPAPRHWRASI